MRPAGSFRVLIPSANEKKAIASAVEQEHTTVKDKNFSATAGLISYNFSLRVIYLLFEDAHRDILYVTT